MGASPAFQEAAVLLGATLAQRGTSLVYGGASVGLMGALADAVPGKPDAPRRYPAMCTFEQCGFLGQNRRALPDRMWSVVH